MSKPRRNYSIANSTGSISTSNVANIQSSGAMDRIIERMADRLTERISAYISTDIFNNSNEWYDSLDSDEIGALDDYKGTAYEGINRNLRNGKIESHREHLIKQIDSALKKGHISEDKIVYRGFKESGIVMHWEMIKSNEQPYIVTDLGYVSTSLSEDVAKGFADHSGSDSIIAEIRLPKGINAANMERIYDMGEAEILLERGTTFEIIHAWEENGHKRIRMEVIRDEK